MNESTYMCLLSPARHSNGLSVSAGISDFPSLEDVDEPPIAVAVIHHKGAVAANEIHLSVTSVYGCGVETVEEVGINSLGMGREEELLASSSVCSSCSSPSESSYKTECSSSSVRVAVTAST